MFESVWRHFYSIVETLLAKLHSDTAVVDEALDILCYCLISCVFLNLKYEKMQFANQYLKFKKMCDQTHATSSPSSSSESGKSATSSHSSSHDLGSNANDTANPESFSEKRKSVVVASEHESLEVDISGESWYDIIESDTTNNAMDVVALIYKIIAKQKEAIKSIAGYNIMKNIASKLTKRDRKEILQNNSSFVREGELTKVSKAGRETEYYFSLFSDTLIYCHQQKISGGYKVHQSLSLIDMSVSDLTSDSTFCSFAIDHPTKSFVVIAPNMDVKYAWLRDVLQAIELCKGSQLTSRKLSVVSKLEDQFLANKTNLKKVSLDDNSNQQSASEAMEIVNKSVSFNDV